MANKYNKGILLDVTTPAASPVSGAISGVTPKVSSWIKTKGLESIAFLCTTTSTADGTWSAEVSNDEASTKVNIVDRSTLANPPTFPTGTSQNATATIYMLGYSYLRLTFTPSAGAGNANAATALMVSKPADLGQVSLASVHLYVPAADTFAGAWLMETSNDWSGIGGGTPQPVFADGQWTDIVESGDPAIASPAGSGQTLMLRLGLIEMGGVRLKFTPSSGYGSLKASFVGKGA